MGTADFETLPGSAGAGGRIKGDGVLFAHDFAKQGVACYMLCRRWHENVGAAKEGKGM